jgi:hypothetical protein
MSQNPSGRQSDRARAFYAKHPDLSIASVVKATGVGTRTVARVRRELVLKGLIAGGRNAPPVTVAIPPPILTGTESEKAVPSTADEVPSDFNAPLPSSVPDEPVELKRGRGRPRKDSTSLLDDEAMRELSGMLDVLADSDDIEATRRRLLKQTQRFVFDPSLHADTRMSASTLWTKLVDMARAKDLGPGKPLTLADAIARATDFLKACGAAVAVPAFYAAFDLTDPTPASAQPQAGQEQQVGTAVSQVVQTELALPSRAPVLDAVVPPSPNSASPWG